MAHLIVGGAPAGMSMPPVEESWRMTRTRINIMTIHGNKSTAPRGTDILEFPFRRIRRLKKANLEDDLCVPPDGSSKGGGLGTEGIRLTRFWTRPIVPPPFFAEDRKAAMFLSHAVWFIRTNVGQDSIGYGCREITGRCVSCRCMARASITDYLSAHVHV